MASTYLVLEMFEVWLIDIASIVWLHIEKLKAISTSVNPAAEGFVPSQEITSAESVKS